MKARRLIRKILGWLMVSSPITAILAVFGICEGVIPMLKVIGLMLLILAFIGAVSAAIALGIKLIFSD